ncbi:MAG: hypothetical protein GX237_06195 [Clostridiales bacterium]|nr:hypothetical protein [Clostridiales bacterium]
MLRKLLRHELYATGKTLLPIYGITILLSLLNRLVTNIDIFNGPMEIIPAFMQIAYGISIVATIIVTVIIIVLRFYKNLMTDEGYLMFTLPVKAYQLINSKLISSIIWTIISVITVILSLLILLANPERLELLKESIDNIVYILKISFGENYVLLTIELGILLFISMIQQMLLIFVSIAVGHLFNGRKVLGSFAAYIGINTAVQIALTILMVIWSLIGGSSLEELGSIPQLLFPFTIIMGLTLSLLYYLVTNYIFSKKLNLE